MIMGTEEDIKGIEDEIKKTKYNKHTQYHVGQLKAKLAKLKEDATSKGGGGIGKTFSVRKSGDATVILVGFPSVGKSTLINSITSADSKIGEYDFTTLDVIPGVMEYCSAKIQVLDIPGVVSGASSGRGMGKEILSAVRNADLIIIIVDKPGQREVVERELYDVGFRLNEKKPDVVVKKTDRGGVRVSVATKLTHIDEKMVRLVLNERGMHNADVVIRENITLDRLIDSLSKNRVYAKSLVVYNKIDLLSDEQRKSMPKTMLKISSLKGEGIEELRKEIWDKLSLSRIYMKRIGKGPDMEKPLIIRSNSTIEDVASKVHREFARNLEYARIWGPSAKFPGQKVGGKHVAKDRDVVELHMK